MFYDLVVKIFLYVSDGEDADVEELTVKPGASCGILPKFSADTYPAQFTGTCDEAVFDHKNRFPGQPPFDLINNGAAVFFVDNVKNMAVTGLFKFLRIVSKVYIKAVAASN